MNRSILRKSLFVVLSFHSIVACNSSSSSSPASPSNPISTTTPTPQAIPFTATNLSFFAGNLGSTGNADGTGAAARFDYPNGIAKDSSGNMYVVDSNNHTIRKVTAGGVVTTFAGTPGSFGTADGNGAAARFYSPVGITVDSNNNLFVADSANHTIRKITPNGDVTTLAGTALSSGSNDSPTAKFYFPAALAVDSSNNIYVADSSNHTIRKITPSGVVSTLAGLAGSSGSANGTGSAARFNTPTGVAVDNSSNTIYIADSYNHTIRTSTFAGVVGTLAGLAGSSGSANGNGTTARFTYPNGLAVDSNGIIFVADTGTNLIRKITTGGDVSILAGLAGVSGALDGPSSSATLDSPQGLAFDGSGNLYATDTGGATIRQITTAGVVSTFVGSAPMTGATDGTGASARFNNPNGVAIDTSGNIFVADTSNQVIRKITVSGTVTTFAGTAGLSGTTDGTGASARFNDPYGITTDSADNIFVADSANGLIRKITPSGVVSIFAGTVGSSGSVDGIGTAAKFNNPVGITTDSSDNLYVADSSASVIRKITPAGVVTTLAGTAGIRDTVDGTGATARFFYPRGVTTDKSGNIYVSDMNDSVIRKITSTGVVTTLAGSAGAFGSADGFGSSARFSNPLGMASDGAGNIFVVDSSNNIIRKITPDGTVSTIVGTPLSIGFIPGTIPSVITSPSAIAIQNNKMYIVLANGLAVIQ